MQVDNVQQRSEDEWRQKLTPEAYRVLREKGTEAPFTGTLVSHREDGTYRCVACSSELFSSAAKFDSGTGWPSFVDVLTKGTVVLRDDTTHGMRRTEVVCARCGGHLGHVFDDGPSILPNGTPGTGKRYCINSCALDFNSNMTDE